MDPSKSTPTPETKLHFLDYWRIIRIRKTVIILVFLLVAVTATFVTLVLPVSYSSKVTIKVERDSTDVSPMGTQNAPPGMIDPYFVQTEFEVIQSQLVLDKVIEKLHLNEKWWQKATQTAGAFKTKDSRGKLKGMLELHPERGTSLIDITVYSEDKQEAADIANTIAEVYATNRYEMRQKLIAGGIDAFNGTLKKEEEDIAAKQTEVDELRQKLKVTDPDAQGPTPSVTPESLDVMHYNSDRIEAEKQYTLESTLLGSLKKLGSNELRETLPRATQDAILNNLLQDKINAETRLVALTNTLGMKHPDVLTTMATIDDLNVKIEAGLNGALKALETKVAMYKAGVDVAEEKVNQAKTNDLQKAMQTHPYWVAKQELDQLKRFREVLEMRIFQESADRKMPTTTMVEIINRAETADRPVKPNKFLNIALGIVVGLVVGLGLAFFIEYLDTSVKTIDDVERTLQSPVLGVIPQNVGFLLAEGAESPHAEAYRVLRTNLLFSRKDDKLNTVAVVSAGAGEGKSTTVINLATVFAQAGQRVLIVDSDLRRPTLHKLLSVSNSLGLTNYLMKQNRLEEVIQTTALPTLDFLPSGKLPSSSLGILNSAQMKDLLTELKQRYDFVFLDSPPIMGVSDASILASEVDMTLQVIQYRRYPQPMNIRAKQSIEKVGGNLIGIVLNNINMSQDENYYYYSGYYHDYYAKDEDEAATGSNGAEGAKPRGDIKPKY